MAESLTAPPLLSTSDTRILSEALPESAHSQPESLSDEQIRTRYEISRTVEEIGVRKWKRVALQFPDQMLPHSARVYQLLARGLNSVKTPIRREQVNTLADPSGPEGPLADLSIEDGNPVKLTILGDTSYGSCCVDEIAAEHVDADAVIHYGRACLSSTARLPVLHIYTTVDLDLQDVVNSFQAAFPNPSTKAILTADVPYSSHVPPLLDSLTGLGYSNLYAASIVHDPSSAIPNRTVPTSVSENAESLLEWSLFHISEPPTSLLLTLHSRMASIRIFPTKSIDSASHPGSSIDVQVSTSALLRRRYALVTSLTTVSAWGILINTLSVKNYLSMLSHIQSSISRAGKKSYLFVVGKLNPAKLANFSEIGGWVVIGCWESSLVDSRDFFKPIITPFELEMVLMGDEKRIWTGEWRADFQRLLEEAQTQRIEHETRGNDQHGVTDGAALLDTNGEMETDSESEDDPPEFDLRTGSYVSRTRPMQKKRPIISESVGSTSTAGRSQNSHALTKKSDGTLIGIDGIASPAAEFLAQKRTWRGLGSDFEVKYEEAEAHAGSVVSEGLTGVARGYTVGEDEWKT